MKRINRKITLFEQRLLSLLLAVVFMLTSIFTFMSLAGIAMSINAEGEIGGQEYDADKTLIYNAEGNAFLLNL